MDTSFDENMNAAVSAFFNDDSATLLRELELLIQNEDAAAPNFAARLLRAYAYEFGKFPEGVNIDLALEDYRFIIRRAEQLTSHELTGAARMLFVLDAAEYSEEIESYCLKAIEIDSSLWARMLLGELYVRVRGDTRRGRRWFLSAAARGSPWGLWHAARTFGIEGRPLLKAWVSLAAFLIAPVFRIVSGRSGPFGPGYPRK